MTAPSTIQGVSKHSLAARNTEAGDVANPLNPKVGGKKAVPQTLIQPKPQDVTSETSNTPLLVRKAPAIGVTDRFQKEKSPSRFTRVHDSQHTKQFLTGRQKLSLNDNIAVPLSRNSATIPEQGQGRGTCINRSQNQGQQNIPSSHTKASRANAPGQNPVQKRKVSDMIGVQGNTVAPSKKMAITSREAHGAFRDSIDNNQISKTYCNGERLSVAVPVPHNATDIDSSLNLPNGAQTTQVNQTSIQPRVFGHTNISACPTEDGDSLSVSKFGKGHLVPSHASAMKGLKKPEGKLNSLETSPARADCSTPKVALKRNSGPLSATPVMVGSLRPSLPMNPKGKIPEVRSGCKEPVRETQNPIRGEQIELLPSIISRDAEPYFEYSVSERWWSDEQDEHDVEEVTVILRPFTDINEANAQAETLFQRLRDTSTWNAHHVLANWTSKRDEHGCLMCKASFSPFDNPSKEHFGKIWVRRDYVSELANRKPQDFQPTPFISSTVFVLRLAKLIAPAESSDSDSSNDKAHAPLRVYQPLIRSEVFTTLHEANRAARDQQLELSHEKEPKNVLTVKWQEENLKHLSGKLRLLNSRNNGKAERWESEFNGFGIGGDRFELKVEQASICGPRNL